MNKPRNGMNDEWELAGRQAFESGVEAYTHFAGVDCASHTVGLLLRFIYWHGKVVHRSDLLSWWIA
jgi:hypothetical protein